MDVGVDEVEVATTGLQGPDAVHVGDPQPGWRVSPLSPSLTEMACVREGKWRVSGRRHPASVRKHRRKVSGDWLIGPGDEHDCREVG